MPLSPKPSHDLAALGKGLAGFFDAKWYTARYPDVEATGHEPVVHFLNWGAAEGRDPNPWFDSAWYSERYPDVVASGMAPVLHYLVCGAAELRNPHPRFDAAWYAEQHPEAAGNPLLHHLLIGAARGWPTERAININDFLPSTAAPLSCPRSVQVDVVIPAYRGLAETKRCIDSVLADPDRPAGRVIVVDDHSPEPDLSAWLTSLAAAKRIVLVRNARNLGFVASANRGIEAAVGHDVALLNSDTEVPAGWLRRLAAQAYADERIASVSPFSNNATICGYPSEDSGPLPLGLPLDVIDTACRIANAGRSVSMPTTVGFCMYIRRAALDEVGAFDEHAFGRGYGEENDFCMRAIRRGWQHALACDTFVYHEGAVSFGAGKRALEKQAMQTLAARYPSYAHIVARHVSDDAIGPPRFAVTAALYRQMGLPVVLMLSHGLGGGVQRHIDALITQLNGRANALLLESSPRGFSLKVPGLHTLPVAKMPAGRLDDLIVLLQSAGVSRVHIHHLMGMDLDARTLIHRLGVPFDVTVHDYFAICPQVNLLPWLEGHYCGEPGPAGCNACIADRPSHGAKEIGSWRRRFAWQFYEAERVICPSRDVLVRLQRYGLADRAIVAPHEPVPGGISWVLDPPPLRGRKLRVAVLGVLAEQKGAQTVIAVAEAMDPAAIELQLIGYPEQDLPDTAAARIIVNGEYAEADLPGLLAKVKPHVVWFPAQWPETYSYTLSAALDAGLPVVASRIGAFIERLEGRPLSWLVDPRAGAEEWLAVFEQIRDALARPHRAVASPRPPAADFYAERYLPAASAAAEAVMPAGAMAMPTVPRTDTLIDLRRPGRLSVVVIPERLSGGVLSPCAYIRLLQPLDHPAIADGFAVILAEPAEAVRYRADVIVTQRHAVAATSDVDSLAAHCRRTGTTLLYDLDDDLLHIPREHPDAATLRPKSRAVQRMLRHADVVWVSTPALADNLGDARRDALVVPNGLDERLWCDLPSGVRPGRRARGGPLRILCMGTATHTADFAIIEPALERLNELFGSRISIEVLGVTTRGDLPDWVHRPQISVNAAGSYPGFVNWITQEPGWDIGLAPLADTAFNRCKSSIKALDYAALGLAVVASDGPVYRDTLADGAGGLLAANLPHAWFAAISRLLRDGELRRRLAAVGATVLARDGTLAAQAAARRAAWLALAPREAPARAAERAA